MKKITLTEALAELKLYDKKIQKKLNEIERGTVIDIKKGKKKTLVYSNLTEEDFKKEAQSIIDSLRTLIKNRAALKSKIVEANAKTEVVIAGNTYTIAAAIDRKKSIQYDINLMNKLSIALNRTSNEVKELNEVIEREVDNLVQSQLEGDKKNNKADEIAQLRNMLLEQKEVKLVNPMKIDMIVEQLNNEIELFQSEVDIKLSIANANTLIEIEE